MNCPYCKRKRLVRKLSLDNEYRFECLKCLTKFRYSKKEQKWLMDKEKLYNIGEVNEMIYDACKKTLNKAKTNKVFVIIDYENSDVIAVSKKLLKKDKEIIINSDMLSVEEIELDDNVNDLVNEIKSFRRR
jgi:hypothetical protein